MKKKYMKIKEFIEKGYLQELNRRFLHPLGLALEAVENNSEFKLNGIIDCRKDKEGIYFDLKNSNPERKLKFIKNFKFIEKEFNKRKKVRSKMFNGNIEEQIKEE